MEYREGKQILVVNLKINKNSRALKIEEMIGKRKQFIMEIMGNFSRELKFDFNLLKVDLDIHDDSIKACLKEVNDSIEGLKQKDATWFNQDNNFRSTIIQALSQKEQALNKTLNQWRESHGQELLKVMLLKPIFSIMQ